MRTVSVEARLGSVAVSGIGVVTLAALAVAGGRRDVNSQCGDGYPIRARRAFDEQFIAHHHGWRSWR